jgi:hypothetical protein
MKRMSTVKGESVRMIAMVGFAVVVVVVMR